MTNFIYILFILQLASLHSTITFATTIAPNIFVTNSEEILREALFSNYSKSTIPVKNSTSSVNLLYGMNIEGLVYFDQKAEKIKLNTLTTLIWTDEYLRWDNNATLLSLFRGDFIVISNDLIWQPDLELYNSGSRALTFERNSVSRLYKNGLVVYNRPTSYTFSCKLALNEFPFDKQDCQMTFGSWKYPKATLNLRPFTRDELLSSFTDQYQPISVGSGIATNIPLYIMDLMEIKNISVNKDFSHNEWNIVKTSVRHIDIEYRCCPGDLWPNTFFKVTLDRNPNKYIVMIIMSVFITISSLVVNTLNVSDYKRTYISVFIPLTLIWLQIHSSSKIPVIENSTLLERIIQLCFYTTIISAFESGIIFNMLSNKHSFLKKYYLNTARDLITTNHNFKGNLIFDDGEKDDNSLFESVNTKLVFFDKVFRICLALLFCILFFIFI